MKGDGRRPSRRRYLANVASGGLAGLAGCSGDGGRTGTHTSSATPTQEPTQTPTRTPTATPGSDTWDEGGPPDRSNWTVTFQDAFDAGALDWDVWEVGFGPYNDHHCAGSACARRSNVRVADDRLVLETTRDTDDQIPNSTWLAEYVTGAVTTGTAFSQVYGYFEVKAKLPAQPGSLPAFWAWSEDGNPPEIDFYESFGPTPTRLTTTIHGDCDDDPETEGNGAQTDLDRPIDEAFRVYGCSWGPDGVTWYLDGEALFSVDATWLADCQEPEPLFPIVNTHVVGGEDDFVSAAQAGDPADADYPYTHEVEWLRVWQHEDWA